MYISLISSPAVNTKSVLEIYTATEKNSKHYMIFRVTKTQRTNFYLLPTHYYLFVNYSLLLAKLYLFIVLFFFPFLRFRLRRIWKKNNHLGLVFCKKHLVLQINVDEDT